MGRGLSDLTPARRFLKMGRRLTMSESVFPPSAEAVTGAHVSSIAQYRELYDRSINELESVWDERTPRFI